MARKSLGYVELEWTCPNCGGKNPGSATVCGSCGAPQPEDVKFEQPAQEEMVTDAATLERAQAGPDIHCPFCGARNPAGTTTCARCGGDLAQATARQHGHTVGAHRDTAVPDVACAACGSMNPANAHRCSQCGSSLAAPAPETAARPQALPARGRGINRTWIIAVAGFALLACAVLFFLSMRTDEVIGTVTAVSWERTVAIEALGPVEYEAWRDEIPGAGVMGGCTERVRRTQDSPAPNSVEVCGTPYTVDEGSGFGQVVQDCQYEVYDDWCTYTVEEWAAVDEVSSSGSDFNPVWPALQLDAGEREGERDESYQIEFDTDGRSYDYTTSSLDVFRQCEIGSVWILNVNTFNSVVSIDPSN